MVNDRGTEHLRGPLAGLRVLDLTRLAPGPYATMLLGDLGADVITIEPPPRVRASSNPSALPGHGGPEARRRGINPLFRSRRCITLDLKDAQELEIALELADRADVFIEGFRPGVCDRLGLGFEALRARNPRLVYCSLTGFGSRSPSAMRAGHDLNYLAEAGLLAIGAGGHRRPGIPMNVVADLAAGGMVAALGILAALRGRDATGQGAHVDVSMFEGVLSMLAPAAAWHTAGAPDPSWGGSLHSGAAPFYTCYATADERWLAVAAMEEKFFVALCEAIGHAELAPLQFQPERWPDLRSSLEATFRQEPLEHWLALFEGVDTAISPVLSLPEAFDAARRDGVVRPDGAVGPIPRISGYGRELGAVVRTPDEHRAQILAELGR